MQPRRPAYPLLPGGLIDLAQKLGVPARIDDGLAAAPLRRTGAGDERLSALVLAGLVLA